MPGKSFIKILPCSKSKHYNTFSPRTNLFARNLNTAIYNPVQSTRTVSSNNNATTGKTKGQLTSSLTPTSVTEYALAYIISVWSRIAGNKRVVYGSHWSAKVNFWWSPGGLSFVFLGSRYPLWFYNRWAQSIALSFVVWEVWYCLDSVRMRKAKI